jgi:hypothetical protein
MRKMNNRFAGLFMAVASIVAMSCDNNDEIKVTDPNAEFDAILKVKEDSSENANFNYNVTSGTGETIKAKVTFETSTVDMKRLYITRNVQGFGEEPYEPSENIDLKADGAVDLEGGDGNKFEYQFELPVPDTITVGTVVYSFWATTGNGDFRDQSKRLAIGPGTITIKYGTGANPDEDNASVISYSDVKLFAPLADGSSSTFISLLDGQVYKIKDGAEFAAKWDFGYYYTNAAQASLASTSNYESSFSFVDVDGIAGTTDLNEAKFALSSMTSAEFDDVAVAGDIDFTSPTQQKISGLVAGDVIEFIDNYGKKGLIRVDAVVGTFNSTDYIQIDIKMQP